MLFYFAFVLAMAPSAANSQSAASSASSATTDPKELMMQAAKLNNLTGPEMQPWHLKASYQLFDDKDNVVDNGMYEEYWVNSSKFKRSWVGANYSRIEYGSDKGLYRSGNSTTLPSGTVIFVRNEFVEPLPRSDMVNIMNFTSQKRQAGDANLTCVSPTGFPANPGTTYCLSVGRPAVRVNVIGFEGLEALHNHLTNFQGHFVAGDVEFVEGKRSVLKAKLESIEALNPVDDAVFVPPADAKLVPKKYSISSGVAQGMLLKKTNPVYPDIALTKRISGVVVLQAVIGTDGHIADLKVVQGPQELQQAAMDAVKTWAYKPFLINGQAVEVNTTINVVFTLSR